MAATALASRRVRRVLPQRSCQVFDGLAPRGKARAAFRWGVTLGEGVRTYVVTPAVYLMLPLIAAQRLLFVPAMAMLYALARGVMIAIQTLRGDSRHDPCDGLVARTRLALLVTGVAAAALTLNASIV
jgi:hypothetical protein